MTVTAIIFPHCALDHLNILNDLKNSRIKNILTRVETKSLTFLILSLKMYNKNNGNWEPSHWFQRTLVWVDWTVHLKKPSLWQNEQDTGIIRSKAVFVIFFFFNYSSIGFHDLNTHLFWGTIRVERQWYYFVISLWSIKDHFNIKTLSSFIPIFSISNLVMHWEKKWLQQIALQFCVVNTCISFAFTSVKVLHH